MKRFLLVLACLAMLLHSCVSEHEFGNEKQDVSVSTRAVVGENASDPYRLESMQMALEELAATGIAEFKIPGDVSIPINYNVRITYLRPGHTEPSQAVIPVADYERAPYPPERDWFNR